MRLTLVVAHTLPAEVLAGIPAIARLSAYAPPATIEDVDAALLEAAGAPLGTPAAPFAALGAGLDPGDAYVLRADPVALVAGRDDVLLAGRIDDLAPADAQTLLSALNRHFEPDGLAFHAPRPYAWFVTARDHVPVDADPIRANEPIHPRLPRGEHGGMWRRWLSEMQMLLHEHPVNALRETEGRAPVTGVWVSGGGAMPRDLPPPSTSIHASPGRHGDVARGLAQFANKPSQDAPPTLDSVVSEGDALIVLPATTDAGALAGEWLDPCVAALERGLVTQLTLLADGPAGALRWRATRPSWWQRLRARNTRRP